MREPFNFYLKSFGVVLIKRNVPLIYFRMKKPDIML